MVVRLKDVTLRLTPSRFTVGATNVEYCDPVMVSVLFDRFAVALAMKGMGLN
jgi:hypothetical protein